MFKELILGAVILALVSTATILFPKALVLLSFVGLVAVMAYAVGYMALEMMHGRC